MDTIICEMTIDGKKGISLFLKYNNEKIVYFECCKHNSTIDSSQIEVL